MKVRAPTPDFVVNMARGEDPAERLGRAIEDAQWVLKRIPWIVVGAMLVGFVLGFIARGAF